MEDHGNLGAADLPHAFHVYLEDVLAVQQDFAINDFSGWVRDQAHHGECTHTFSTTALSNQAQSFAFIQLVRHAIDGFYDAFHREKVSL